MKFSQLKSPNTYVIIFSIIVLVALLSWVIPGGNYSREDVGGKQMVVPGSFRYVVSSPQGIGAILTAPIKGFSDAAQIIGFVLIVGGVFGVLRKTEAVDSTVKAIAAAHERSAIVRKMLIPLFMLIFSLGGAVFGMSEEVIPFVLIFVPLALMLGYDSITGVAIPFVGAAAGFAGAFLNPFTVGVAQSIAELPLFSGFGYRFFCWFVVTAVSITFVMVYAVRIKKNPEKSPVFDMDKVKREKLPSVEMEVHERVTKTHKTVLMIFLTGMAALVIGVLKYSWYIDEIAGLFLLVGILCGIAARLKPMEFTDSFISGAKDLIGTALVIALARGILIVSQDGKIIDTILHFLSSAIGGLHPIAASQAMFGVQTFINFFVPSGSGQAALTMPVMAPLSDLVGVGRQTAVLAFQFGDGFSNIIIPTSAVTMGVLALAGIPWEKWARWVLPLELILLVIGLILLIPPFYSGWN